MKKLFALAAVALTLCGLLTACGSKTETANDVDLTGFYNALAEQYGWSASVPNLSGKLRRGSLRYQEAVELAHALGYEIVWKRQTGGR